MKKLKRALICFAAICLLLTGCLGELKYYTDAQGNRYRICRSESGDLIVDSGGRLCVYLTNENGKLKKDASGELMTAYVSFPGQIVSGDQVETPHIMYQVPAAFQAVEDGDTLYYDYNEGSGRIFIDYFEATVPEGLVDDVRKSFDQTVSAYGADKIVVRKYSVSGGNIDLSAVSLESKTDEYDRCLYYYFFPYKGGCYRLSCSIERKEAGRVNFDRFARSFSVKA